MIDEEEANLKNLELKAKLSKLIRNMKKEQRR